MAQTELGAALGRLRLLAGVQRHKERSDAELLNRASAFVMQDEGVFKMWYVGGSECIQGRTKTQ